MARYHPSPRTSRLHAAFIALGRAIGGMKLVSIDYFYLRRALKISPFHATFIVLRRASYLRQIRKAREDRARKLGGAV